MLRIKYFGIFILGFGLLSCGGDAAKRPRPIVITDNNLSTFSSLHTLSENIYDGAGTWGESRYGYRMALRDSYWRADVYNIIATQKSTLSSRYAQRAQHVATYLQNVQANTDGQIFGFPADEKNVEFGDVIKQVISTCPECIKNGWVVSLPNEHIAELYYDHGYALTFMARFYKRTLSTEALQSAIYAADWALDKPLHHNINYLSALSKGLSYAYAITRDPRYLQRAIYLHEEGILPYLSEETGAAIDRHNQQLEYHGFIVSGLIALTNVMPKEHILKSKIDKALTIAVTYMQQNNMTESAEFGQTWPGTNLIAWYELAELRVLSKLEKNAKNRCIENITGYLETINQAEGFQLRKALYSYFSIGLFP